MNNNVLFLKPSLKCLCLLLILSIVPLWTQAADKSHLRGERYCEILVSKTLTNYAVYNTLGLNDCPELIWKKVTVAGVKKESGADRVHLNGPRYWVIDGLKNSTLINPTTKTICGLQLREAGVLHIGLLDLLESKTSYHELKVARKTTWVYDASKLVYELISPAGKVFVMQSYSVQQAPQTEESLAQLATKLKLPKGWQFKTGILKKIELLQAINNQATVVQDNLLNTYQLATHDFLGT